MTARLYYTDQTLAAFDATIRACDEVDGRFEVLLDRSAFYPASGGQPADLGRLGPATVVDVFERGESEVVHVVDQPLDPGTRVEGRIDWMRRFDHMQQHTGQHVLSAAFDRSCRARTVSFHMGGLVSTIDLVREVTAEECRAAEAEANRVVWEDRPAIVRFATAEEAARLPLRKESIRTGTLRLIDVEAFDLSACGGTHVARTGMIGAIAITQTDRFKGATRVTFVCGGRALTSHRLLRDVVAGATRVLSVAADSVVGAVERILSDNREAARRIRTLQEDLARYQAEELRAAAETIGRYCVVLRAASDLDGAALKGLASAVVSRAGVVAVLAGAGTPTPVVVACGSGSGVNAAALLKDVLGSVGGRGGGTSALAQGGVPVAADAFLEAVKVRLQTLTSAPGGGTE